MPAHGRTWRTRNDSESIPWPTTTTSRSTATFPLKPGVVEEVRPGVRRVLCNNPSPFTFTGTVSYIVGTGQGRDHRSRPRRRGPCRGAAGCGARRDRDAYLRHPHPPRPFAEHRADQGRDRRDGLCRRPAPRLAAALREREAQSGIRRRPRLQARHHGARRRDHRRRTAGRCRRWRRRATPPIIWRSPGRSEKINVRRRPRDGLVDLDRGAAGRLDDRLHGLAGTAGGARRICISPATARKFRKRRAMCVS